MVTSNYKFRNCALLSPGSLRTGKASQEHRACIRQGVRGWNMYADDNVTNKEEKGNKIVMQKRCTVKYREAWCSEQI